MSNINNLLISYLNPFRTTFEKFIFKDEKGMYKYIRDESKNLSKIYIDTSLNFISLLTNTCEELHVKETDLKKCHKFLFNAVLNFDNKNLKTILKYLKNMPTDFFDFVKEDIPQMNHNIILLILKNFNFDIVSYYDEYYERTLNKFINTSEWYEKNIKDKTNLKSNKLVFLLKYLQILVDYINSNPVLLNPELDEFTLELYYMKNFEEFMQQNYEKNAIYNDILAGILSSRNINSRELDNFLKDIKNDEYEQNSLYATVIEINRYLKSTIVKVIDTKSIINMETNILAPILTNLIDAETEIYDKLIKMIRYIAIQKKIPDKTSEKKIIDFDDMEQEIDIFLKLKAHLINTQENFLKKFPKRNFFYKYN